jgi:hypothetical protein
MNQLHINRIAVLLLTGFTCLTGAGCCALFGAKVHPDAQQGIELPTVRLEYLPSSNRLSEQDHADVYGFMMEHERAASALGAGEAGGFEDYMKMFHYPTFRVAGDSFTVLQTPDDIKNEAQQAVDFPFPDNYWRSQWTRLLVVDTSPTKVHIASTFARLRKDGSIIHTVKVFYILEKQDGRWGIRGRSSFKPVWDETIDQK